MSEYSKSNVVLLTLAASFLISLLFFYFIYYGTFAKRESVNDKISAVSLEQDNLLVFAVRVNEISKALNDTIKESKFNLPPVKIFDSNLSYKDPGRSWVVFSDDLVLIVLYRDVVSALNQDEIKAVAVHELCHVILGHVSFNPLEKRDINKEKNADECAVNSGTDPYVIISAIAKLASDGEEKSERISALVYKFEH